MSELNLTLKIWRQEGPNAQGHFETHQANGISTDMSFLEMLDIVNEDLVNDGKVPIEFDHDCREGICGTCDLMINGQAHGNQKATTTCQLHMRKFSDGDTITVEPFRAKAFPVVKDLVVDRSAFDRIIEAGGYISVNTSFDAAACIGCGACVAACPNSAAQLFTSAKLAHLNLIPQGQTQRWERTERMVETMEQFFGSCTNHGECHEACPKEISLDFIAFMNRDYIKAKVKNRKLAGQTG